MRSNDLKQPSSSHWWESRQDFIDFGRGKFFAVLFGALILYGLTTNSGGNAPTVTKVLVIALPFVLAAASAARLRNIGRSALWGLFALVPALNLFLFLYCASVPENGRFTKEIDFLGWVVIALLSTLVILLIYQSF